MHTLRFGLIASGLDLAAFHQTSALALVRRRFRCRQDVGSPIISRPRRPRKASKISYPSMPGRGVGRIHATVEADEGIVTLGAEGDGTNNYTQTNAGKKTERCIDITSNSNADDGTEPTSESNAPICRVVATSDGKISPFPAFASLSHSSKALLDKIELLYTVESQKQLRELAYVSPRYTNEGASQDESYIASMEYTEGRVKGMGDIQQEENLVSVLKQSLEDGGFKLMNQRDLDLCSALNAGYLLRLSLLPDVRDFECIGREFYPELYERTENAGNEHKDGGSKLLFDGRVLIFRRGYSKEITTGRLLLPKLDYLQASLVQRSSAALTRKLGEFERKIDDYMQRFASKLIDAIHRARSQLLRQCRSFIVEMLENFGLSENEFFSGLISNQTNRTIGKAVDASSPNVSSHYITGNKISKFARYLTSTSTAISNELDLNDALSPFLLCKVGDEMEDRNALCLYDSESSPSLELSCTPAAVSLLERISIQNTVDFFSKKGRRDLIRNYFKSSTLVEPAYEEVIVVWRPRRRKKLITIQNVYPPTWLYKVAEIYDMEDRLPNRKSNTQDDDPDNVPLPLEIKAFYDVPMANIEAVLPKTKLIFRPADAIVFDLVSVVSFLAVAGSLKFDSPKLDIIALVSLIFFAVRTFFRYSNKYARYDLLVNKFITSKISHRGPGKSKFF